MVDAGGVCDGLDGGVEGLGFGGGEVRGRVDGVAAAGDDVLVYDPHVVEAEPLQAGGPAGGGGAVS